MNNMKHAISNVDEESLRGDCAVCGPVVPLKKNYGRQAGTFRCRTAWQSTKYKEMKDGTRISLSDIAISKKNQGGVCAICKEAKPLVVDHCHESKKFRGLLCRECNLAIGYFQDDLARLASATDYLSSF